MQSTFKRLEAMKAEESLNDRIRRDDREFKSFSAMLREGQRLEFALDRYNRLYNNTTFLIAEEAIREDFPVNDDYIALCNLLIDASFSLCGYHEWNDRVPTLFEGLATSAKAMRAAVLHLANFS